MRYILGTWALYRTIRGRIPLSYNPMGVLDHHGVQRRTARLNVPRRNTCGGTIGKIKWPAA